MSRHDPSRSDQLSQGSKKTTTRAPQGSKSGFGLRRPPVATQFKKNTSGNPRGRPKASRRPSPSPIEIIMDRPFTITQDGKQREVTVEEALQLQTFADATAGNRTAEREIWKWVHKRDKWRLTRRARRPSVQRLIEPTDPDNADEALILLGIAEPDNRFSDSLVEPNGQWRESLAEPGSQRSASQEEHRPLLLRPWAVQLAISRNRRRLSAKDISEIKRCTRDAETLRWPAGSEDEQER